jgi:predicted RNA-binding protein with PIN domain
MPALVDGHNLIPHLGLKLESIDDEQELINLLQVYCRLRQTELEVFFDNAPPGHPVTRKAGRLTAHFIRQGSSADAAIENRLLRLKNAARNWTVVSSDGRVQRAARAASARSISSPDFARTLAATLSKGERLKGEETQPSPDELEDWLRLFNQKKT